jgi:hypothetical protein
MFANYCTVCARRSKPGGIPPECTCRTSRGAVPLVHFIRKYSQRACLCFLLALCAAGCGRDGVADGWAIELERRGEEATALTAAPDGTLFLAVSSAGGAALYRRAAGGWERVAGGSGAAPRTLSAPGAGRVFGVDGATDVVTEWTETGGLTRTRVLGGDPALPPEVTGESRTLTAVWARGDAEAYAVGTRGAVVRYDGRAWTRDTAAGALLRRGGERRSMLNAVGGGQGEVWVAGYRAARLRGGAWTAVPLPDTALLASAAVAHAGGALVAGTRFVAGGRYDSPAIYRWSAAGWDTLPRTYGDGWRIAGGAAQADGSALFWGSGGRVVRVAGGTATALAAPGEVRGAAVAGGRLYLAANAGGRALVLRADRLPGGDPD